MEDRLLGINRVVFVKDPTMGMNTSYVEDMVYNLEKRVAAMSRTIDELTKRIRKLEKEQESTVEVTRPKRG